LLEALSITPDVVFEITVEGNRPDAWSVEGVARDLATRLGRPLTAPALAEPNGTSSARHSRARVSTIRTSAGDSPCRSFATCALVRRRRGEGTSSGRRHAPISNVVDASNLVMLELGQPTHPYDAAHVAQRTLRARRARPGETIVTLDGVERKLAVAGRGLGDTGEDCVIVDGDDQVLGSPASWAARRAKSVTRPPTSCSKRRTSTP